MAYSLYDAAVTPCAQQLGALAGIIDKAAAHCAANKIEESALLQDRLYPDMYCLARQTCFCGLFRLATTASSSARSAVVSLNWVLSCIP